MRTKERLRTSVRWLCFVILLAAAAIRLSVDYYNIAPAQIVLPQSDPYPTLMYEPSTDKHTTIENHSGVQADVEKLMKKELLFSLSLAPQILIVHTHATEAYCSAPDARSQDKTENVVHIGTVLAQTLRENGINAICDETLIDAEGYYDAYARAATLIEGYLQEYPSIQMVIDVHRDSVTNDAGQELAMTAEIDGESAAQLMLVMGTDQGGLYHPNWEENLSFALKLQDFCEGKSPGVFRKLVLRAQRYNQHLTPQSILIEVGTAGNTLQQAETSIRFFGQSLAEFLHAQS